MRRVLLLALSLLMACSPAPTSPTPTPKPVVPIPAAAFAVEPESLTIGDLTTNGWPFAWKARNTAASGCAVKVRGELTLRDGDAIVMTTPWELDPSLLVKPGATFTQEMCCLPLATSGRSLTSTVSFQWENVACP